METITATGKWDLTEDEKRERAQALCLELQNLEEKKSEKAEVTKSLALQIVGMEARISELSKVVRQGWEYRVQECRVEKDYERRVKMFVSVLTGEVLEVRPFGPNDFQMGMNESA